MERKVGINENLAREILELHTLGVGGGYTQADVTTFAQVITGWSIGGRRGRFAGGEPGQFVFRAELHEPGAKVLLNTRYPDRGLEQGLAVLGDLARHPSTAHFIATKLARHFIADDPPPAAVARVAGAFMASEGDLPSVYRALLEAREAWAEPLPKYKTPNDFLVSAYRGLSLPVAPGNGALAPLEVLGQRTWQPGSPAGWPDRSRRLGRRLGAHEAHRVGRRGGTAPRQPPRRARSSLPQLLGANLSAATRTAVARAATRRPGTDPAARRTRIHASLTEAARGARPMGRLKRREFLSLSALAAGGAFLTSGRLRRGQRAQLALRARDPARRARRAGGGAAVRRS